MAARRCIFLAGAPEEEALCWDGPALLSSFDPPFRRFLAASPEARDIHNAVEASPAAPSLPKWRSVVLKCSKFDASGSLRAQNPCIEGHASAADIVDSDFLEHSIAVLERLDSSQIIDSRAANGFSPKEGSEATFISFNTSLTDTSLDSSRDVLDAPSSPRMREQSMPLFDVNLAGDIIDLKRIPKAEQIQRMQPQTITVNLLVGIVAVLPARRVQLRRRKLERDIIEVTVGDETRSGFGVTFWLLPDEGRQRPVDDHLRRKLHRLRPGQVILLRSVALCSFRGSVYGQSLNKSFTRNSTLLDVLDDTFTGDMPHLSAPKLQRVRQWTSDFVGNVRRSSRRMGNEKEGMRERSPLPPDTQD